jgi:hypothetical protein
MYAAHGVLQNVAASRKRLRLIQKSLKPIALSEKQEERASFTFEQFSRSLHKNGFQSGEQRLRNIIKDLDFLFPDGKYDLQVKIHSETIRACLRQILGKEYNSSQKRLCKQFGWDGPKQNAFFVASRRGGKTTGMASVVAALMVNVPNMKVVNFSGGEDSATEFTKLVGFYAQQIARGKQVKITMKKTVVFHVGQWVSYIAAFPSGGRSYDVSDCFLFLCSFDTIDDDDGRDCVRGGSDCEGG